MQKNPQFYPVKVDISHEDKSLEEKALVDIKLLNLLFKDYTPAGIDEVRNKLILIVNEAEDFNALRNNLDAEMYLMEVATSFHTQCEDMKKHPAVEA